MGGQLVQQALRAGARVIGVVARPERLARIHPGAEVVVGDDAQAVAELAGQRSARLLVDTIGGARLPERIRWIAQGGRAVLIGYVAGTSFEVDPPSWLLEDVALLPLNMIRREARARELSTSLAASRLAGELTLPVDAGPPEAVPEVLQPLAAGDVIGRCPHMVTEAVPLRGPISLSGTPIPDNGCLMSTYTIDREAALTHPDAADRGAAEPLPALRASRRTTVARNGRRADYDAMNSVLGKVHLILGAFGHNDESLSLSEISRRSGVAKASVHRLSQELLSWGILERRGTDYWLGMRLFEIGQRVPRQRILRDAARPFMEDLFQATGETIHLAVRDGLEVLYVEKVSGHNQISRPSRVAGRLPLHCTATGKALLAFGPRSLFEDVVARPLARITPSTVVVPRLLATELTKARSLGYAVEQEQTRAGFMSVAIPIFGGTGTTVGALSVTAPVLRADVAKFAILLSMVSKGITKSITLSMRDPDAAEGWRPGDSVSPYR